jgi:hypothetical protein
VIIAVLANDTDVEHDPLSVKDLTQPVNGTAVLNADQTITYTPKSGFAGTDAFTYRAADASGTSAPATVTVTVLNRPPIAVNDSARANKGSAVTIAVLSNDSDPDGDKLSVVGLTQPTSGTVVLNADGTIKYTPKASFNGTDTFTYNASDGSAQSSAATVTVKTNAPPAAANDSATTIQDVPVTVAVLANDTDSNGDALSVTALTQPANGTADLNSTGTVTYTPKAGFAGTDTFTYRASDGLSQSNAASVTVQVTAAPGSGPTAASDSASTNRNQAVIIAVLANDVDPAGHGVTVANLSAPASGKAALNPDGTVTYIPNAGFVGTDRFTYRAFDGMAYSAPATVSVTVVNRPPVGSGDAASTSEGTAVRIPVLANDTDPDADPLTVTGLTSPTTGTAVLNMDGTVTYTPKKGFSGTATFTYKASDGLAQSAPITVTISVLRTA